jgi:hypothetical protein
MPVNEICYGPVFFSNKYEVWRRTYCGYYRLKERRWSGKIDFLNGHWMSLNKKKEITCNV